VWAACQTENGAGREYPAHADAGLAPSPAACQTSDGAGNPNAAQAVLAANGVKCQTTNDRATGPRSETMSESTTEVMPEIKALAMQIAQSKAKELAARKLELKAKYPHTNPETLRFDATANKYSVEMLCTCGKTRRIFTSDAFQVRECVDCSKAAKTIRKAAKKALIVKALAMIEAGEVK